MALIAAQSRKVGALGNITFQIGTNEELELNGTLTHRDLQFSANGRYATHELIGRKSIVESTGRKPSEVSFSMTVSTFLGTSVKDTLNELRSMVANGYAVPLVIGNEPIGDYRWVVEEYTVKGEYYDRAGALISADVQVRLLEYPRMEATLL